MKRRVSATAQLVECIQLGVPTPGTASHSAAVLLGELSSLANHRAEVRESAQQFETDQVELFAEILERGANSGEFSPALELRSCARLLLAAEDGLATSVLAGRTTAEISTDLLVRNASLLVGQDLDASV